MSQHTGTSKYTKITLECCNELHNFVGTIFSLGKLSSTTASTLQKGRHSLRDSGSTTTKIKVTHPALSSYRMYTSHILGDLQPGSGQLRKATTTTTTSSTTMSEFKDNHSGQKRHRLKKKVRETDRQIDRDRDRVQTQTDRQTDRQKVRDRERVGY